MEDRTHINAYITEAQEAVATAKAAVGQAEAKLNALITKIQGGNAAPETLPKEPGVAGADSQGEADAKTQKVKYK